MSSTNRLFKKLFHVNNVKVKNVDLVTDHKGVDHLSMKVDLYKKDKCRCPICHKKCPIYDHPKTIRRWRALDLGSIIGEIEMKPVRIECKKHGVLLEEVPNYEY